MRKSYLLLLANYLYMAGVGFLSPIYALFVLHIKGGALAAGLTWSIYLILAGIIMILVGGYQDRTTHIKGFLIWGYGLAAISTFAYLLVDNLLELILLQLIHAIGIGILTPALRTAYTRIQDKTRQGHEWALFDGGIFILQGAAALIGGALVSIFNFTILFLVMGLVQICSVLVVRTIAIDS